MSEFILEMEAARISGQTRKVDEQKFRRYCESFYLEQFYYGRTNWL